MVLFYLIHFLVPIFYILYFYHDISKLFEVFLILLLHFPIPLYNNCNDNDENNNKLNDDFNELRVDQVKENVLEDDNIIMEEAAGYLEGQKTAQEVAKVIQSRAKIYVSENS